MSAAPPKQVSRYFLVLFAHPHDNLGDISYRLAREVKSLLDEKVDTPPAQTEIDVWLESPGGDAHAAYRIFLDLQYRCRRLRAVIPDYAKSAATLLVLGMDEIFMAPSAELGPLDAQIEHPDREGITVSALDVSKSIGFLGNFAIDYIVKGGDAVLRSTGLPRAEVLRGYSRFAARFLEPVVTKIDPHLVHRATNQLAIAHHYAKKMLDLRRLSDDDRNRKCNAKELATRLVEHYPAHEFVISRDEARDLPLPIRDGETYDRWNQVRMLNEGFHDGELASDDSLSVIMALTEQELDDIFHHEPAPDRPNTTSAPPPKGPLHDSRADSTNHEGAPQSVATGQREAPNS